MANEDVYIDQCEEQYFNLCDDNEALSDAEPMLVATWRVLYKANFKDLAGKVEALRKDVAQELKDVQKRLENYY